MTYQLKDEDYFKLWMHFEDKADKAKESMFNTLTWTIGFAAALLGFIFATLTDFDVQKAQVALWQVVLLAAIAGLLLCLYSYFMLSESGRHIQRNWDRANRCRKHVEDFEAIIHGLTDKGNSGKAPFSRACMPCKPHGCWLVTFIKSPFQTIHKDKKGLEIWERLQIVVGLFAVAFLAALLWSVLSV